VLARLDPSSIETCSRHTYGKRCTNGPNASGGQGQGRLPADQTNAVCFWRMVFPRRHCRAKFFLPASSGFLEDFCLAKSSVRRQTGQPVRGEVYLVGAGPRRPDLLTFRALRLSSRQDWCSMTVWCPQRSSTCVARPIAERHTTLRKAARRARQYRRRQINQLFWCGWPLNRQARVTPEGRHPFIFGRGGEEIEELAAPWHSPFQVVPGIHRPQRFARPMPEYPVTHRCTCPVG